MFLDTFPLVSIGRVAIWTGGLVFCISWVALGSLHNKAQHREVWSIYECGFDSFIDMNTPLEIHFYLVCLLYILFDIELVVFLPYFLGGGLALDSAGKDSVINFFGVLTLGYLIEYYSGVLNWVDYITLWSMNWNFFD